MTIARTFKATCITYQNDDEVVMVGFADSEFDTSEYLLFQRSLEPDDQDPEFDEIHVELAPPQRSEYGGVELIHLAGTNLKVELGGETAQELGANKIEVELMASKSQLDALKKHLMILVGDKPILQID